MNRKRIVVWTTAAVCALALTGAAYGGGVQSLRARAAAHQAQAQAIAGGGGAGGGGALVNRVAGANRYLTSAAASRAVLDTESVSQIVIVNAQSNNYADAMSAAGLAGQLNAPVLFANNASTLPPGVLPEMERIVDPTQAVTIWFVGGTSVLPNALMTNVGTVLGAETTRVAGIDKYETSAKVAEKISEIRGGTDTVGFVATGDGWSDAIACAPLAYNKSCPVLLTKSSTLPQSVSDAMVAGHVTSAVIVGGTSVVSDFVESQIQALSIDTTRPAAGATKYDTARMLAQWAVDQGVSNGSYCELVTASQFPDGLAGSWVTGSLGGCMLYLDADAIPSATRSYLQDNGIAGAAIIDQATIFGGRSVTPAPTFEDVVDVLNPYPHIQI